MGDDNQPSGRALRRYISDVLVTDSDLNAFCLDYYPAVHRSFGNGMDRHTKLDLLLAKAEVGPLLRNVREAEPERARRFEYHLKQSPADEPQDKDSRPLEQNKEPDRVLSREELFETLCQLQLVQFEEVVFRMGLSAAEAAPDTLPQKKRAMELIRQAEQHKEAGMRRLTIALLAASPRLRA